ncbi:MAG: type 1 glutamine amidotransferase-like domain-containing protein [Bacteroidales bacterium]|nr:type 1 glutamine amidotransferase-like domain-containing protein [Bacteroidales bacterium]
MHLLLLSNSTNPGEPYLAHALEHIQKLVHGTGTGIFIPYAAVGIPYQEYLNKVNNALAPVSIKLSSIDDCHNKKKSR